MDKELNERFQNTEFSQDVVRMFAEILEKDDVHRKILRFIGMKQRDKENVSIIQLVQNIHTERRVKVETKKSYKLELQETLIDRKAAERIVDKLASMSLLYYESMNPYKLLFLTNRGVGVLQSLEQNRKKNREDV